MSSFKAHTFHTHNYKRPTLCAHCGKLLVGLIKQGVRCKRCEIDVHDRCQEDLKKSCVELISGQHNFRKQTFHHPTSCDYCDSLLIGVVNQGLKCSECGSNVHEKCQELIEAECSKTLARKGKGSSSTGKLQRTAGSRTTRKGKGTPKKGHPRAKLVDDDQLEQDITISFHDKSELFEKIESAKPSYDTMGNTKNLTPVHQPTTSGQSQTSYTQLEELHKNVQGVVDIMKVNAESMNERNDKLDILQTNARDLEEKAKIFEDKAEQIKRHKWLKNKKLCIILSICSIIVLLIIVISLVVHFTSNN